MSSSSAQTVSSPDVHADIDPENLLTRALDLVKDDMGKVNHLINRSLDSDIALIRTLGTYIIHSGGKRLRPLILLLSAGASEHGREFRGDHHITLATVIEFIHTATLLHDDVVDESVTRRGQATANEVWGNGASVLVGDFLYSRAFELMVETDNMEVMRILAKTTNSIAEGEVLQLLNAHDPDTTEEAYFDTIQRKSACLFEAAANLGGIVSGQNRTNCRALAEYGMRLGLAFQLMDDIMDYVTSSTEMGKEAGDDLAEGKPTLPLIHAMREGGKAQEKVIRDAILGGSRERMPEVLEVVRQTGAIDYTQEQANQQARLAVKALVALPTSDCRSALENLAHFSVSRSR